MMLGGKSCGKSLVLQDFTQKQNYLNESMVLLVDGRLANLDANKKKSLSRAIFGAMQTQFLSKKSGRLYSGCEILHGTCRTNGVRVIRRKGRPTRGRIKEIL